MSMIFITGDIHGDPFRLSSKKFPEGKELTNIFIGDMNTGSTKIIELFSKNIYTQERASRNQLSITTKFNPYIVAGFPAAVVDNIQYGTYFLAIPVNVVHRLSVRLELHCYIH